MSVLHERKVANKISAVYLYSYSLETTLVYQFCCRCSRAKHAAKQGSRFKVCDAECFFCFVLFFQAFSLSSKVSYSNSK